METASNEGVDVVIVSWNTSRLLQSCLRSLLRSPEADDLNIVVVDNGSVDDSVAIVESFPNVRLVRNEKNEGFARANNQGFAIGSAPYVLLLNSDAEVDSGVVKYCRDYLSSHLEVGVVGPRIFDVDGVHQSSVFRYPSLRGVVSTSLWLAQAFPSSRLLNHDRYGQMSPEQATSVEVVMGSFLMVRRSDHPSYLLDDRYFMYAEEADLCRRTRKMGLDVRIVPDVSIRHVKGASSRTPSQQAWSDEAKKRAVLQFIRKWDGLPTAYVANLVMLAGMVPRSFLWILHDLARLARRRQAGQALKMRALGFHFGALLAPWMIGRRFHGPRPPRVS